jgi:hypothetical protein
MVNFIPQSLYHRGTHMLRILQDRVRPGSVRTCVEKETFLVPPGFETGTLLLVVIRFIYYLIPEYTGVQISILLEVIL